MYYSRKYHNASFFLEFVFCESAVQLKNKFPEFFEDSVKVIVAEVVAKELNNFFVNTVKSLISPNYENYCSLTENINDSTLSAKLNKETVRVFLQ